MNANVLGFFSDNEINFSSQNSKILDRFPSALTDKTEEECLYVAAKFMDEKGATGVTDNLNNSGYRPVSRNLL